MSTPSYKLTLSNLAFLCLMASVPQLRYDHSFSSDFSDFQPFATGGAVSLWTSEQSLVPNSAFEYGAFDQILPSESHASSASLLPMLYPLHINVGSGHGIDGFSVYDGGYQPELVQSGEDCCGFVRKWNPVHPVAGGNWGFQSDQIPIIEESSMKVFRYSEEKKKERIVRYLKKRNQRNFNKTIKYACRKTLADRRVRVRGRFTRNSEASDPEMTVIKHESPKIHHHSELHPCDVIKVAVALEKAALADEYFVKRKLYPNLDFYSGLIYRYTLGNGCTIISHFKGDWCRPEQTDLVKYRFQMHRLAGSGI